MMSEAQALFPPRASGEGDREAVEGPPRKARRNVRDKLDRPSRPAAATPSTRSSAAAHFPASGEEKTESIKETNPQRERKPR